MGFASLAAAYLLGGLTFLPIIALGIWYFSIWYLPNVPDESISPKDDDFDSIDHADKKSLLETEQDTGVNSYMTGWVTISREYFIYPTGGSKNVLNPPEKTSTDEKISQSESAYSSLYKLMSNSNAKERRQKEKEREKEKEKRKDIEGTPADDLSIRSEASSHYASSVSTNDSASIATTGATGTATKKEEKRSSSSISSSTSTVSSSKLNKYYAVLKHGNILLYTNENEEKVKHVIVIAKHIVMLWPPDVPDAELFIKRSAICLVNKDSVDGLESVLMDPSAPPKDAFYLYMDNCAEKEDFYFALIRASKRISDGGSLANRPVRLSTHSVPSAFVDPSVLARPLKFQTDEIMNLILTLHSSDSNIQTRWLNALLGRIFLGIKDTPLLEAFFRDKIARKLARVKRPNFLTEIELRNISCGHSIPYFTNPKLKELTPEGLLVVEVDVSYKGGFSVEIGTKAVLNLGQRFKSRDVSLILAVTVKKVEGRMIFKIKQPPSNRIWYAFESMPKLSLGIEPVVSTRQVTYSIITKAIESRIAEVIKETLVMPYMDDLVFHESSGFYRGGIWEDADIQAVSEETPPVDDQKADVDYSATATGTSEPSNVRHRSVHRRAPSALGSEPASASASNTPSPTADDGPPNFNISEHIGELKGFGFTPESRSSAKNIYGTVKKWGTWYLNKEKMKHGKVDRDEEKSGSTNGSGGKISPISAPLPHTFPPEMLNQIKKDSANPYTPVEMKLPTKYPSPVAVPGTANNSTTPSSSFSVSSSSSQQDLNVQCTTTESARRPSVAVSMRSVRSITSNLSSASCAVSDMSEDEREENTDLDSMEPTMSNSTIHGQEYSPYRTQDTGVNKDVSRPPNTTPRRKPVPLSEQSVDKGIHQPQSSPEYMIEEEGQSDGSEPNRVLDIRDPGKRRTSSVSSTPGDTVGFHPGPPTAATATTTAVASQRKITVKRKEVGSVLSNIGA